MNKEAIQLLNAASSDSDSASDLQFSLAPQPTVQVRRKIRTKRYPFFLNVLVIHYFTHLFLKETKERWKCISVFLPGVLHILKYSEGRLHFFRNRRHSSSGLDSHAAPHRSATTF